MVIFLKDTILVFVKVKVLLHKSSKKKKKWMGKSTAKEETLVGCSTPAKVFCYANRGQMVWRRCERGHLQHVHLEEHSEGKAFGITFLPATPQCCLKDGHQNGSSTFFRPRPHPGWVEQATHGREGVEVRAHTHGVIRLTTHKGFAPGLYKKEDGGSGY